MTDTSTMTALPYVEETAEHDQAWISLRCRSIDLADEFKMVSRYARALALFVESAYAENAESISTPREEAADMAMVERMVDHLESLIRYGPPTVGPVDELRQALTALRDIQVAQFGPPADVGESAHLSEPDHTVASPMGEADETEETEVDRLRRLVEDFRTFVGMLTAMTEHMRSWSEDETSDRSTPVEAAEAH